MVPRFFGLLTLALSLSTACVPVVLSTATATGVSIAQEKSMGDSIDDTTIWTKISSDLLQKDVNNLFNHVNIKVTEGRVLLTGNVPTPENRVEAVKIAWRQRGVKEVIDEIKVASPSHVTIVRDFSKDTWITAQLKSKLLFDPSIHSVNYSVETIEGVVYLIGIAQNKQELDEVTNIASTIKYVQRVINFVRIKNALLRSSDQNIPKS